jgi:hypothetical protein
MKLQQPSFLVPSKFGYPRDETHRAEKQRQNKGEKKGDKEAQYETKQKNNVEKAMKKLKHKKGEKGQIKRKN